MVSMAIPPGYFKGTSIFSSSFLATPHGHAFIRLLVHILTFQFYNLHKLRSSMGQSSGDGYLFSSLPPLLFVHRRTLSIISAVNRYCAIWRMYRSYQKTNRYIYQANAGIISTYERLCSHFAFSHYIFSTRHTILDAYWIREGKCRHFCVFVLSKTGGFIDRSSISWVNTYIGDLRNSTAQIHEIYWYERCY